MLRHFAAGLAAVIALAPVAAPAETVLNDFPTEARADYVFGCMKANGETQDSLRRCSCSIDVIATLMPYAKYEAAATFVSLAQMSGENGVMFRNAPTSKASVADLRRAQAEAEIRCF